VTPRGDATPSRLAQFILAMTVSFPSVLRVRRVSGFVQVGFSEVIVYLNVFWQALQKNSYWGIQISHSLKWLQLDSSPPGQSRFNFHRMPVNPTLAAE